MANSNSKQFLDVNPAVKASWVKFTITGVYGKINNGGSFKIYHTGMKIDPLAQITTPWTNTNNHIYKRCTESTKYDNNWGCNCGLSEKWSDGSCGMWATRGQGTGAQANWGAFSDPQPPVVGHANAEVKLRVDNFYLNDWTESDKTLKFAPSSYVLSRPGAR